VAILNGAHNNQIGGTTPAERNIISGNLSAGVNVIDGGADNNTIQGNYIGTDVTGTVALPNQFGGIDLFSTTPPNGPKGNTISGNVISGNVNQGIAIRDPGTSLNIVTGNFIGTNATGTAVIPNTGYGVGIFAKAHDNRIGGTTPAERNIISGNANQGVTVTEPGADNNTIEGNYIGTDVTGNLALPNLYDGIALFSSNPISGPQYNTISGNLVSGNTNTGILLANFGTDYNTISGNYVGTNAAGTAALGNGLDGIRLDTLGSPIGPRNNTISGNVSSANTWSGIALSGIGTNKNTISGNYAGTDATGTVALGNKFHGIVLFSDPSDSTGPSDNTVKGNVASGNGTSNVFHGILIAGSGTNGNIVIGNFAGTNATGTAALGNAGCGVKISNAGSGNIIGGTTPAERNILSGNLGCGVGIQNASGNTVIGNYIGLNASGNAVLGNQTSNAGIFGGGTNNRIGGTTPAERNVIAGSGVSGVRIYGLGTFGNFVTGNYIGTDANGTSIAGFGNAAYGIDVFGGANRNFIGGTVAGAGNLIGGSGQSGIRVSDVNTSANSIWGNLVGVNASSTPLPNAQNGILIDVGATGNLIGGPATGQGNVIAFNAGSGVLINSLGGNPVRGNSIYSNGALGIKYTSGGVSAPVFTSTSAVGSIYQISGTLSGTPSTTYALDFYVNAVGDPSGRGQGQTYLGAATITTDAAGNASFGPVMFPIVGGQAVLSATATDNSGLGDTSEFATNAVVILPNPTSVPPGNGGPGSGDCVTIALTAPQQTVLTGEQITLSVRLNNNCAQSLTNVVIVVQVGHPLTILSPNPNCQQVTLVAGTIGAGQQYVSSVTVSTGNAQVIPPTAVSASAGDTTIGQFASFVRPMSASSSLSAARAQTVVNVIQASWDDQNVRTASQTLTVLPNNHLPNTGEHPAVPAAFDFATTSGLLALAVFGLMGTVLVIFGLRQNNKRGV